MVPELEKPSVTEIHVRMDCNGCVQKIKKALHGINGIYDVYIDIPQQKLTVIGWADPERIVTAIRKTRKIATICSYTEPTQPPDQPTEQAPEDGAPPPEEPNPPPPEAPPEEGGPPAEEPPMEPQPPEDPPPPEYPQPPENPPLPEIPQPPEYPPPPEHPQPEVFPTPAAMETNAGQISHSFRPWDVRDVHAIYHHPPDYGSKYGYGHGYSRHWNRYSQEGYQQPPQPIYATHSYNSYRPSPYVTEYEYIHSPPRHMQYGRADHYSEEYHNNNSQGNVSSMFSDENPNACSVM